MLALIGGFFAKSALARSPVGAVLGGIPRRAWIAMAIVLLLAAGYLWHEHKAGAAIAAAEERGAAAAYANVERQARELEAKADALNARIAEQMRKRTDAKLDAVARDADDLRMRGPGAARCTVVAGIPAAAGGRGAAGRPADAAMGTVRDSGGADLIALPFAATAGFAGQHDSFRLEALAWRGWHARFTAERARWTAEAKAARQGQAR